METDTPVYEIDVNKKYVLSFDAPLSHEALERIRADIDAWLKSDRTFMIIHGGVKLVRVDVSGEAKE